MRGKEKRETMKTHKDLDTQLKSRVRENLKSGSMRVLIAFILGKFSESIIFSECI